jgi:hypothetical protein
MVRPRDIPEVTLIKGTEIYKKSYVLAGLCPQCQTQYSADRERVAGQTGSFDRVYINSAVYLKVGQNIWVDRVFSSVVLNAMDNFHASANAYTDFWNNTFGELCKGKPQYFTLPLFVQWTPSDFCRTLPFPTDPADSPSEFRWSPLEMTGFRY